VRRGSASDIPNGLPLRDLSAYGNQPACPICWLPTAQPRPDNLQTRNRCGNMHPVCRRMVGAVPMALLGSLFVVLVLMLNQLTIGRWHFLHGSARSPWLSVSAGTAIAYVFVYLLPKLALSQQKLDGSL